MLLKTISVCICGLLWAPLADAVIIAAADGSQNTTAPAGGQGWDYVGRVTSVGGATASATYLSNNWFITAYHVKQADNPTGVQLGGSSHSILPGSWTRITNNGGGGTDLVMFRVEGNIPLLGLKPSMSEAPTGASLTLIGNGRDRDGGLTYWDASWAETVLPDTYSGFRWASGSTKRWGTNEKAIPTIPDYFDNTDAYFTTFDESGGANEAQGATYDSGGGVFYDNGAEWELSGIMIGIDVYPGQPGDVSAYGNSTFIADISAYADQIQNIASVPEPAVIGYLSVVPILYLLYYRIRRKKAEIAWEKKWGFRD
jgi:hypothetical protein